MVAEWNLARLAEALLPLFDDDEERAVALAQESLGAFRRQYSAAWLAGMKAKLGLDSSIADDVASPLVDEAARASAGGARRLHIVLPAPRAAARGQRRARREACFLSRTLSCAWAERWRALNPDADMMDRVNPAYMPRNHLVEEALDAATNGDLEPLRLLLEAVTDPYNERPGVERYAEAAPENFGPYRTFCGT